MGEVLPATCDPERPLSSACEIARYARLGSTAAVALHLSDAIPVSYTPM